MIPSYDVSQSPNFLKCRLLFPTLSYSINCNTKESDCQAFLAVITIIKTLNISFKKVHLC